MGWCRPEEPSAGASYLSQSSTPASPPAAFDSCTLQAAPPPLLDGWDLPRTVLHAVVCTSPAAVDGADVACNAHSAAAPELGQPAQGCSSPAQAGLHSTSRAVADQGQQPDSADDQAQADPAGETPSEGPSLASSSCAAPEQRRSCHLTSSEGLLDLSLLSCPRHHSARIEQHGPQQQQQQITALDQQHFPQHPQQRTQILVQQLDWQGYCKRRQQHDAVLGPPFDLLLVADVVRLLQIMMSDCGCSPWRVGLVGCEPCKHVFWWTLKAEI